MVLALKSGAIKLFDRKLSLLSTIYHQTKKTIGFTWHPEYTVEDECDCKWLASATREDGIYIYECNGSALEVVRVLHTDSVVRSSMSWSTHRRGMLACTAEDGIYVSIRDEWRQVAK